MRHNRVQRGKIVGAKIDLACAEQRLECLLAHADIQTENARPLKIRNMFIRVVCAGNGRERQHAISTVEEKQVAQIGCRFDAHKRVPNVICNTLFVHGLLTSS